MLFASFDRVSIRDGLPTVLFIFIFCFSFIRLSIVLPVCFACGSVGGGGGGGSGGSFGGGVHTTCLSHVVWLERVENVWEAKVFVVPN